MLVRVTLVSRQPVLPKLEAMVLTTKHHTTPRSAQPRFLRPLRCKEECGKECTEVKRKKVLSISFASSSMRTISPVSPTPSY